MADYGRDLDIGTPDPDTVQVNVVLSQPITDALKEQVADKLEETNARLLTSNHIQEHILGQEFVPDSNDD